MKRNYYIVFNILYNGFLENMKKIKLFWDDEPKKVDLNYAFDLYLDDRQKWLDYIYRNIWYIIRWSKFKYTRDYDWMEMTSDIIMLIDRKLQEQIVKYDVRNIKYEWTAKRIMCYIMVCIRWVLFNSVKNKWNDKVIYIDTDEIEQKQEFINWWVWHITLDEEQEFEYMKYQIAFNNKRSDDERNIVILLLEWTPKRDIYKFLWYKRKMVEATSNELKIITYNYLKNNNNANNTWTIKREPSEIENKGNTAWEDGFVKSILNIW